MSEERDPLLELPRMQFHLFVPLTLPDTGPLDSTVCDICGQLPQAHPTPEALAEWERAQEDFNA